MTRDDWSRLLNELLEAEVRQKGTPVPGARLRRLLEKRAVEIGAEIPSDTSFLSFVLDVAPDLEVVRRKGSDVLFLPSGRQDLLPKGRDTHLRKDLFDAFTTISANAQPWYDRERDRVVWRPKSGAAPAGLVAVPAATLESEIELRRAFASSLGSAEERAELEASLAEAFPLRAFSRVVRQRERLARWLAFRNQRVRSRLEDWSRENSIAWRDSWLTELGERGGAFPAMSSVRDVESSVAVGLGAFLARLDAEDLRRVQVPLDLVIKLMRDR